MIVGKLYARGILRVAVVGLSFFAAASLWEGTAQAQFGFGLRGSAVGGVAIDASGTVRTASIEERTGLLNQLRQTVREPAGALAEPSKMRMVSLLRLQEEIARAMQENRPLAPEVLYLAGLQRVEFVFVYPDDRDIVIAGPAEPWMVRQDGSVVGRQSGRPVLQLEDLITALRTVPAARNHPISVSIEPTPEGQQRLTQLLSTVRPGPGFDPSRLEAAMREAFGPQLVKLATVDPTTRMAAALVAADYEMKRLAMNLEPSPVTGLPSYMEMIRNTGAPGTTQPRWWMESDYDAIEHSDDRLAWRLVGRGVKALTEQQYIDAQGVRRSTGVVNKTAERWAQLFTEKFDALCGHNAAFGDLRNIMDLNIVATVIRGHELDQVARCDLGLLYGEQGGLQTPAWTSPKTVAPECSFIRGRAGWTVSASGGVAINPWRIVVEKAQVDENLKVVHVNAADAPRSWWWD